MLVGEEQKEIVSSVLAVSSLWDVLISVPTRINNFPVCCVLDLTCSCGGEVQQEFKVFSQVSRVVLVVS